MSPSFPANPLSTSELLAVASSHLSANGYLVVRDLDVGAHSGERGFVAEDDFGVVSVLVFDSWAQLENEWRDAQADLVELLSARLSRSAPKAWDGYLVLLCSAYAGDSSAVNQIERDTTRVRKIVATGENLQTIKDVEAALDLLLPLKLIESTTSMAGVLQILPTLIPAVDSDAILTVVDAFQSGEPPLERLHAFGRSK
ncbi:hypothetical protein GRI69_10245 [Erythrobacter vulgaris]|uniref:Uncharacterized protein n=1 Tax=Qipengyuania vulgaris TaxID=291985 RepID=A0A844XUI3_9SPHN|nr:hypothetical protein [Qipengyuania vulgaris]MXO48638.1 hypothetical protein [Qipengyuania vulgaris]